MTTLIQSGDPLWIEYDPSNPPAIIHCYNAAIAERDAMRTRAESAEADWQAALSLNAELVKALERFVYLYGASGSDQTDSDPVMQARALISRSKDAPRG